MGMTSKTPKERFDQHKGKLLSRKGHDISSRLVKKYGLFLRPSLYNHLERCSKTEAIKLERELALALRKKRYAVWFN